MVPGPLIAVGPLIIIEGDVIMIDEGVMTIELAPDMSVIDVVASRESAAMTVTLRFMLTVSESFIITLAERLCMIVSV